MLDVETTKSTLYDGKEVEVVQFEKGGEYIEQSVSKLGTVVILPYKMDRNFQYIKYVYLTKFPNFYRKQTDISPITETYEDDTDETYLDTAVRGLYEEVGIDLTSDIENRFNYIGQINFNKYFNKNVVCYCVDISNIQIPDEPGKIDNETQNQILYKFKLNDLLNNMILEDALSIACIQALAKTHKNLINHEK